jgi:sulfite reductase (NADPH) flavoprotein alpha-component
MTANQLTFATPLTPEHARQFEQLLATLSPEEALWISGYLAGFTRQPVPSLVAMAAAPATPPLLILYGSETGHAAALAKRMEEQAATRGLAAHAVDMAEFRPQDLKDVKQLALLTSTYGEGDPPDSAAGFYEFLHGRKAPRLEQMHFAVLGLGDSTYERFCQTAKDFDQRLEALGARRLHDRADCDVDYEAPATAWIEAVLTGFAGERTAAPAITLPTAAPRAETRRIDRKHPFPAVILDSLVLNGRGSDKITRHVELSLAGSGLIYAPGDSIGVLPENDPDAVGELIEILDLSAGEMVPGGEGGDISLAEALARVYEVTTLTPRFIEHYAETAQSDRLRRLARPESRAELRAYQADRQIIDVVSEFPIAGLDGKTLVGMLRKLQPRLYSLASSQATFPDEAHLTVAVVLYPSPARLRKGVASAYLSERRGIDDTVPVYIEHNKNFRLPADPATPIIMIGAGTGVAPFRAFMQERALGSSGPSWLFFGDRHFRTDFLYQTEWQRLLRDGALSRMDVAFSRDQPEKLYVQHRLREHAKEIHAWLQEGAHVYVCGDAARMAPDVHAALVDILASQGGMPHAQAEEAVKRLHQDKRYQRDVY